MTTSANISNISPFLIKDKKHFIIKEIKTPDSKISIVKLHNNKNDFIVHNKICIKLKDDNIDNIKQFLNEGNIRYRILPKVSGMYVLQFKTSLIAMNASNIIDELDNVEFCVVEKYDGVPINTQRYIPTEIYEDNSWYLNDNNLKLSSVFNYVKGDGVIIGVSDQGIQSTHPELEGNVLHGWSIQDGELQDGAEPRNDSESHGTEVSGIIAGVHNPDDPHIGISPESFLKTFHYFTCVTNLDAALHYDKLREEGCAVLNCSWGSSTGYYDDGTSHEPSEVVSEAVNKLETEGRDGLGCLLVRSAGNSGNTNYILRDPYTQIYGPFNSEYHAVLQNYSYPQTITVSSVGYNINNEITRSYFSTYGPEVDICAFCGNSIEIKIQDYISQHITGDTISDIIKNNILNSSTHHGISSSDLLGEAGSSSGDYASDLLGTSFSAPLVTGTIGLILSSNPSLTSAEVRDILYTTADQIQTEIWYNDLPYLTQIETSKLDEFNITYQYTTLGQIKNDKPDFILPNIEDDSTCIIVNSADLGALFQLDLYYLDIVENKSNDYQNCKFDFSYHPYDSNGNYIYFGINIWRLHAPEYIEKDGYLVDNSYGAGLINPEKAVLEALSRDYILKQSNSSNFYFIGNTHYSSEEFKVILDDHNLIGYRYNSGEWEELENDSVNAGYGLVVHSQEPLELTYPGIELDNIGVGVFDRREEVSVNTWHLLCASTNIRVQNLDQEYFVYRKDVWYSHPKRNDNTITRPLYVIYKGESYWFRKNSDDIII